VLSRSVCLCISIFARQIPLDWVTFAYSSFTDIISSNKPMTSFSFLFRLLLFLKEAEGASFFYFWHKMGFFFAVTFAKFASEF